ncbi:DinB family protein [Shouchella sp. JSM 1781072]|uniref:DinB family protein n=1 Tax=Bacillaceae TaxID=186817 RepID=UPI00159B8968|nr:MULTISPECIES: DinB family protein [Bacillaceae]UTR06828.1 DinB family protein [Alkalihalobacillus sp. LMS6]
MSTREFILIQLGVIHDQQGWFVPLNHAVKDITPEQAAWTSSDQSNSIWGIVEHLIFYNERYLDRFQKISVHREPVDSIADTFNISNQRSWPEAAAYLNELMLKWRDAVKEAKPEDFTEAMTDLTHLTLHNAYHIGQIVSIRKQQGSWRTDLGVT